MKIFITVGTDHHPFKRLMEWTERAALEIPLQGPLEVIIQAGYTPCYMPNALIKKVIPFDELAQYVTEADIVVTHASSTAILCQQLGNSPLVVPRDPLLGEHVDDHQQRFLAAVKGEYPFYVAWSYEDFVEGLSNPRMVRERGVLMTSTSRMAIAKVKEAMLEHFPNIMTV